MSGRARQQSLFALPPPDARRLTDVERTILEAIDHAGPISAREAGRIVYRFRGHVIQLRIPREWLTSAGADVLRRLERRQIVRRTRGNRWRRQPA